VEIVERLITAKTGNAADCEDGIAVSDSYAAVIDGSTDKTGLRIGGATGGRWAMLACSEGIQSLGARADAQTAIRSLSAALAEHVPPGLERHQRPEAAIAILSMSRREIWQVGDVGFWHLGMPAGGIRPSKRVDRRAAEIRAGILSAELALGADRAVLAVNDPGRAAISSLLARQGVFRNNPGAGRWAYAAIDGLDVPAELISVYQIPRNVTELVVASDGYPRLLPTLRASERELATLLDEDPLCISALRGTKGLMPGNTSYDDRAYLRIRL
jgi:hypothetical protein